MLRTVLNNVRGAVGEARHQISQVRPFAAEVTHHTLHSGRRVRISVGRGVSDPTNAVIEAQRMIERTDMHQPSAVAGLKWLQISAKPSPWDVTKASGRAAASAGGGHMRYFNLGEDAVRRNWSFDGRFRHELGHLAGDGGPPNLHAYINAHAADYRQARPFTDKILHEHHYRAADATRQLERGGYVSGYGRSAESQRPGKFNEDFADAFSMQLTSRIQGRLLTVAEPGGASQLARGVRFDELHPERAKIVDAVLDAAS